MRNALLLAAVFVLCGCGFAKWASEPQPPDGKIPAYEAGKEIVQEGLGGFEKGGIIAGVVGLLFTTAKTSLRLYRQYQSAKEASAAVADAVTGGAK